MLVWAAGWDRAAAWLGYGGCCGAGKAPGEGTEAGKEGARGSRHAQKGCPSEGHCREHRLEGTHVAQQHQGPSKATLTLQDTRLAGSGWATQRRSSPVSSPNPSTRRRGMREHLPMLLWDTGTTESPDTRTLCRMSHKVTDVSPAMGTSHLQSHCPAPSPSFFLCLEETLGQGGGLGLRSRVCKAPRPP